MSDDPFRYCVHCAVDCYEEEPGHLAACPSVTGLWPITNSHLMPCPHCSKPTMGVTCWICKEPFALGDFYVHVDGEDKPADAVPGIEGAHFAGIVTCIGCAATREDA